MSSLSSLLLGTVSKKKRLKVSEYYYILKMNTIQRTEAEVSVTLNCSF